MTTSLFTKESNVCYAILAALTITGLFTDKIPIQVNVTVHSVLIIALGSIKSLECFLQNMEKVWIKGEKVSDDIEQMTMSDAMQFPIAAGCTLTGLYFAMQYFGKESVNIFILSYIAIGGTIGVKSMVDSFTAGKFKDYDKDPLVDFKIKMIDLHVYITLMDFPCFFISASLMVLYYTWKHFILNNLIALFFCLQSLQTLFIGNFKNGFMLLVLLFFYDIFFVFGTDVMLTVAKGIDAPIKLQFPKDWSGETNKYAILGLGDIVIPGVFVSLCLRYDFLKSINRTYFESQYEKEQKGDGDARLMKYLYKTASECPKHFFIAVNFGYLVAIICTIVVMIVFDHGQPALLYLVPGCILSVLGTTFYKGEFNELWEFTEDEYITAPEEEEAEEDSKKVADAKKEK